MKARCPKNPEHKEFHTNATVSETWLVDESGNWQDTTSSGDGEVIDPPSSGNMWECAAPDCGAEAIVED